MNEEQEAGKSRDCNDCTIMENKTQGEIVEPSHKQQQSHDSGAYIDWASEDPMACVSEPKFASNVNGEFVTVVAVEPTDAPSPFVTVLAIGDNEQNAKDPVPGSEDVLVYRLPGERLGFGLKFEGGLKTAERVSRLFIQSCAPDSPASRTRASWGPLAAGDEVLEIDGLHVGDMTRIDCVRALKESNVVIKLRVRSMRKETTEIKTDSEEQSVPPPIPPRKIPRRNSAIKETANIVCPPDGFADSDNNARTTNGKPITPLNSNRQTGDNIISVPEPEVYVDLLAQEAEMLPGESESDDTGSSISTVVDRMSSNSSFSDARSVTSLDITTPPTPTTTGTCPTFDLDRVLEPFLQLEREFSSSATIVENSLFTKLVALTEPQPHNSVVRTSSAGFNEDTTTALQPPENFKDSPINLENETNEAKSERNSIENSEEKECEDKVVIMKTSPRTIHNVLCKPTNDEDESVAERANDIENAIDDAPALPPKPTPRKDISQRSKFKSGKKRPPPPPPPRSDRPLCPNPPVEHDIPMLQKGGDEIENGDLSDHLPRLIDFVPKDRTDVVVPNVIHPEQNQLELLIQRQRLLELINGKPNEEMVEEENDYTADEEEEDDVVAEWSSTEQMPATLNQLPPIGETEDEDEEDVNINPEMCQIDDTSLKSNHQDVETNYENHNKTESSSSVDILDATDNDETYNDEEIVVPNQESPKKEDESQCVVRTHDTPADDVKLTTVGSCSIVNCTSEIKKEETTDSGLHAAMETALSSVAATLNLSPPPSFSRLPPDGHEFPPNYQDPCPDPPSLSKSIITESNVKIQPPPPLPSSAQPLKMRHSNSIDEPEPLRKYSTSSLASSSDETPLKMHGRTACWRNDEKSEKSVRDKIAMFSNVNDECPVSPCNQPAAIRKLNRYKSSEDVFNSSLGSDSSITLPSVRNLSKSVLSVDKVTSSLNHSDANFRNTGRSTMKKGVSTYSSMLDVTTKHNKPSSNALNCVNRAQSSVDLALTSSSSSSSCSSSAYSSCSPESSLSPTASPSYLVGYSSTLPRKHQSERSERKTSLTSPQPPSLENKPTLSRALSFTVGSKLHTRSQSLIDVGSSINKCSTNSVNKQNTEEARRASLNALIEQRRRSISKLRGLVIPEKVTEVPLMHQTIVDLPEIISKDSVLPNKKNIYSFSESRNCFNSNSKTGTNVPAVVANNIKTQNTSQSLMTSPPWKTESSTVNDIPKYSPAFKRKSLALYGVSSSASSVSSSLSSSREELRPYFDSNSCNVASSCNKLVPKQTKSINQRNNINYQQSNPISISPSLQNNEPPKSLESITSPTRSDLSFEFMSSAASSPDVKMMSTRQEQETIKANQTEYRNNNCGIEEPHVTPLIKMTNCSKRHLSGDTIRSGEEESDNDSAVSSSRSSISHDFSPPTSPLPDGHHRVNDDHTLPSERQHILVSPSNSTSSGDRRTLRRTLSSETTASAASSTGSTLTSGSQASCSSSGSDSINRRVLKAQSVEAINRKNVLSSARFSSGQDLKVGSPLIRRKFENPNSNEMLLDGSVECNDIENDNFNNESNDFIDKLNKTLKKEDSIDSELRNENDLINYQLINCTSSESNYPIVSNTKVAYVDMEVTDGPQSLPNDLESKFSDESSCPPSMDGIHYDYPHEEKVVCSQNFDERNVKLKCDNEVYKDNIVNNVFISNTGINNNNSINNNISRRDSESTIEEVDTPSKPFIKRISRECQLVNSSNSINNSQSNNKNLEVNKFKNNSHNNSNNEGKYKTDKNNDDDVNNLKNISKSSLELTSLLSTVCKSKKENYAGIYEDNDCDNYFNKEKQERTNKTKENSPCNSKVSTVSARAPNGRHSISVNDIRKAFEKPDVITSSIISNRTVKSPSILNGSNHYSNNNNNLNHIHARVSSLDSTTSEDSCAQTPTHYGSITNLQKEQQFGSITSLASSTSLISQQELQQLIDDANQTLEETTGNSGCSHEVLVVILHRDTSGGSVGITLAGGADYEAKEITVHKVLAGSPADRDGRIQKGDRILSINGRSMKGMTHRESLTILKAPRPEVVLVVSRWRPEGQPSDNQEDPLVASLRNNLRPPRIPEQPVDLNVDVQVTEKENISWGPPVMVCLNKDGAGLGFSLEGGKDSPLGDMPLTIKKIFTGGCAEKSGELFAGDELLAVNGTDVTSMSRIEAWSLMKRIADGKVKLSLRHRAATASSCS